MRGFTLCLQLTHSSILLPAAAFSATFSNFIMDNLTEHANHPLAHGDEVTETGASSYCDSSSLYCEYASSDCDYLSVQDEKLCHLWKECDRQFESGDRQTRRWKARLRKLLMAAIYNAKSFSVAAVLCGLPAGKRGSSTVSVATAARSTSTLTLVAEISKDQLEHSLSSKHVPHSPQHSHGPLQPFPTRPARPLAISSRPANPSIHDPRPPHQVGQALATPPPSPEESQPAKRVNTTDVRYPNLLLQPSSRPISHEELAAEVKSIYAGLTMVENKCIHVDRAQAAAARGGSCQPSKLGHEHWQALIALHRTLLHEHNDFFLALQHPSARPALRRLAAKYAMPARMWKHGIHSFLELLRRRLPESLEYMVPFLYLAYDMMALFYEIVPAFQDTWVECLGDLARYRMAIEDEDLHDRDIWAGTSRFWYSKAADRNPSVGRLYHHLAILAQPNATQQLYYYCRSLTCVQQFMSSRESILTLLDPFLSRVRASYSQTSPFDASFIKVHGILFLGESLDTFPELCSDYLGQLDTQIGRITEKWKGQGVYVAVTNIASLFNYGSEISTLRQMYDYKAKLSAGSSRPRQIEFSDDMNSNPMRASAPAQPSTPPPERTSEDDIFPPQNLDFASQPTFAYACRLAFTTFRLVLQRVGDENVLPHVHVMLVFLLSLAAIPYDCASVLDDVPWEYLALFLTELAKSEKLKSLVQSTSFPHRGQSALPLPEDYVVQGQVWSQRYYPEGWFDALEDEEERSRELASTIKLRIERILWLGVRLASALHGGRIQYNYKSQRWSAVPEPSSKSSRGNAKVMASMALARLIERIKERRYG